MTLFATPKLHALTTSRFLAAVLIVWLHTASLFNFSDYGGYIHAFHMGVSFFFVLSGFILTYVYPHLDSWNARGRFLLARFARIWPAHLATFVLLWVLLQHPSHFPLASASLPTAAFNLLMLHAWIPERSFYFSFNSVSWTLSTEFAFYLFFPLLLHHFRRTWWWKLLTTLAIALTMVYLVGAMKIPVQPPNDPDGINAAGLLYINPLSRLFEFTLGMSVALLFQHTRSNFRPTLLQGTLLELATLVLLALNLWLAAPLLHRAQEDFTGAPLQHWLSNGPICVVSFGLLIYVFALHAGALSRILSNHLGILLGEISYSLYLVHFVIISYLSLHRSTWEIWPRWIACLAYWCIVLFLSWLLWIGFERPLRKAIVHLGSPQKAAS